MKKRSFRSILLAWNSLVVIGLLSLFGLGVTFASQYRLRGELDRDLLDQARKAREVGPLPSGPPRRNQGNVPERFRPLFEPSQRLADIREPRFFDRQGYALLPPLRPRPGKNPEDPFPPGPNGPPEGPGDPFDQEPLPEQNPRQNQNRVRPLNVDANGVQAAFRGQSSLHTVVWEGGPVRVYTAPFVRGGRVIGAVQVSRELSELDSLMQSQLVTLALFLPIAGVMAALAAVTLANRALRPVGAVTRTASEIGSKDLGRRLAVVGDDELAELASTFNGMLDRLQGAFTDQNSANTLLERALESQRRFTADASHELRTPLTRMRLAAEVSRLPDADSQQLRDALTIAGRASDQMSRLVDQLLTLARVDAGQLPVRPEPLDLRVVAAEAIDGVIGADERVEAHFSDRPVLAKADPDHLRRVAVNLIENAMRYAGDGARIWLRVFSEGNTAVLEVGDEGRGIPSDHLSRVFERFHRVDEARSGGGSGLGLAIARDLARANGGELTLQSREGVGTTVRLSLPL